MCSISELPVLHPTDIRGLPSPINYAPSDVDTCIIFEFDAPDTFSDTPESIREWSQSQLEAVFGAFADPSFPFVSDSSTLGFSLPPSMIKDFGLSFLYEETELDTSKEDVDGFSPTSDAFPDVNPCQVAASEPTPEVFNDDLDSPHLYTAENLPSPPASHEPGRVDEASRVCHDVAPQNTVDTSAHVIQAFPHNGPPGRDSCSSPYPEYAPTVLIGPRHHSVGAKVQGNVAATVHKNQRRHSTSHTPLRPPSPVLLQTSHMSVPALFAPSIFHEWNPFENKETVLPFGVSLQLMARVPEGVRCTYIDPFQVPDEKEFLHCGRILKNEAGWLKHFRTHAVKERRRIEKENGATVTSGLINFHTSVALKDPRFTDVTPWQCRYCNKRGTCESSYSQQRHQNTCTVRFEMERQSLTSSAAQVQSSVEEHAPPKKRQRKQ